MEAIYHRFDYGEKTRAKLRTTMMMTNRWIAGEAAFAEPRPCLTFVSSEIRFDLTPLPMLLLSPRMPSFSVPVSRRSAPNTAFCPVRIRTAPRKDPSYSHRPEPPWHRQGAAGANALSRSSPSRGMVGKACGRPPLNPDSGHFPIRHQPNTSESTRDRYIGALEKQPASQARVPHSRCLLGGGS